MEERLQEDLKEIQTIFLADDDVDDRDLFEEAAALIKPDIRIRAVRDGEELMGLLTHPDQPPSWIFLDLNMPRKNGKECLNEIRNNKDLRNIPLVIYTTSLNPLDIDETFDMGASYFLRKPNSFEELKNLLQRVLQNQSVATHERDRFVLNDSAPTPAGK